MKEEHQDDGTRNEDFLSFNLLVTSASDSKKQNNNNKTKKKEINLRGMSQLKSLTIITFFTMA